ncbi:hypothetical protein DDB_G0272803 [Dictyostelium discoideum AX4]|uniref:Uncharacterized protein n=1 Tax=Dictyostelium discoideum TaxID=44689 RepID=Q556L5_DICDI|nr:hypothetical protein DDB_G0273969 [Dictyostelium discoideum AX4]XP_645071.1 hypothetical protein DDB_G0272803 [Dictyostelium discoideum AX4]EAL70418.1 hypothetical protein DDB_G0273969 [Dictyostelium discoideum AX4]EAL71039.1 hypothetical protein DDB_G0272803 [Dictyostelium discoideum AX4]|eukprot:XP_644343.1 hypothetical protein DDB_G0273969 [Dictyostelium discoideum AX4]
MVYICRGCNQPKKEQCQCKQLLATLGTQQKLIQAQQQLIQQQNPNTNHIMPSLQSDEFTTNTTKSKHKSYYAKSSS